MSEGKELIQVGEIWGTHGLKGMLKVNPLTEDLEWFKQVPQVWLWDGETEGGALQVNVLQIRVAHRHWLFTLETINEIADAQRYSKWGIWVPEDQVKPLGEDEFFIHQIIGSSVYSLEGEHLGVVKDYFDRRLQLLFEVQDVKGGSFLFPAVDEVIKEVDTLNKRVVIDLAPGMRSLNQKEG